MLAQGSHVAGLAGRLPRGGIAVADLRLVMDFWPFSSAGHRKIDAHAPRKGGAHTEVQQEGAQLAVAAAALALQQAMPLHLNPACCGKARIQQSSYAARAGALALFPTAASYRKGSGSEV